jgi:hypothetical protein
MGIINKRGRKKGPAATGSPLALSGAPEATRTPDTGIRNPKQAILRNQGGDPLIGLSPYLSRA